MVHKIKKLLHHYFYPHGSNNYKAKTLHLSSIIFYIILLLCVQISTGLLKPIHPSILGYATDITIEEVLVSINQKRAENNLTPLTLSSELNTAATKKATDMFANNYWAHISPTGTTPWSFITSSGYQYLYAGENLAKDFDKTNELVEAWMNSPTHRANILKPEYTDIGLAVMNGKLNGAETTLVVEEFGSKASDGGVKTIANAQSANNTSNTPEVISNVNNSMANTSTSVNNKRRDISTIEISKTASLAITEFLLIVLFIDSLYIWKFKPVRLSGHSLAHIIFLGALIGAMGATGIGVIL